MFEVFNSSAVARKIVEGNQKTNKHIRIEDEESERKSSHLSMNDTL
jgi:hypothetical protein